MNVLFITRIDPFRKNGGAYATRAYLEAFSEVSDKCDCLISCEVQLPDMANNNIKFIKVPDRTVFQKILFPFSKVTHRFVPFIYKLAKLNRNYADYDTIVMNGGVLSGSMIDYFKSLGKTVITIHHNVEHFYHKDNKTIDSFGGRIFYIVDGNEKNAILKSDLNLSISKADIEELKQYYKLENINTFHYIGCFEHKERKNNITPNHTEKNNTLLITGSLCDVQTKQSIKYFINNYITAIKHTFPTWQIIIAGRNPDDELISLCDSFGIKVIANPDNMDAIVQSCDVYICPTFLGSGLKLRIMDALRNGRPVITHIISGRGYEEFFNKPYFKLYSNIDEFSQGLKTIIASSISQNLIIEDYKSQFSYLSGVNRLRSILSNAKLI